jgi:hypothetical protein
MRFWGKRTFLDPHVEVWHRDCWAWLDRNLSTPGSAGPFEIVLPTREYFAPIGETGHARAEAVLLQVKNFMGLNNWPCVLVERQQTNVQVGEFLVTRPTGFAAAGTFEVESGEVYITYDPALLDRPLNLVTTLAHELAHYVLHTIEEPPPGAEDEPQIEELATELAVAWFGFGLIAANAAFDFQQHGDAFSQGWRGGAWGYFSEDAWVFALAVYLRLREEPSEILRAHLKPHLTKKLDAALKRLDYDEAFLAPLLKPV